MVVGQLPGLRRRLSVVELTVSSRASILLRSARPIVVIGRGERRHQHLIGDFDNRVVFEQVGGLSVDLEGIDVVQAVEIEQLTDHRVCYIRIRTTRVDPDGSLRR